MAHPPGTGPATGNSGTGGLRVAHVRPLRVNADLALRGGSERRETLLQVRLQILHVFKAGGNSYQVLRHS